MRAWPRDRRAHRVPARRDHPQRQTGGQHRYLVNAGEADQNVDHERERIDLAKVPACDGGHQIKLEKASQAPVQGSNDDQTQGHDIEGFPAC